MSKKKMGYIAFHGGKHYTFEAESRKEAYQIAAQHFGVPNSKSHKMIHLEEAPVEPGSNP